MGSLRPATNPKGSPYVKNLHRQPSPKFLWWKHLRDCAKYWAPILIFVPIVESAICRGLLPKQPTQPLDYSKCLFSGEGGIYAVPIDITSCPACLYTLFQNNCVFKDCFWYWIRYYPHRELAVRSMPAVQFKRTIQSPCSFYKGLSFIGLRIIRYNLVRAWHKGA